MFQAVAASWFLASMLTGATGIRPPSPHTHVAPHISASTAYCPVLIIVLPLPSRRNIDCAYRERISPPEGGHLWVLQKIALQPTPGLKRTAVARVREFRSCYVNGIYYPENRVTCVQSINTLCLRYVCSRNMECLISRWTRHKGSEATRDCLVYRVGPPGYCGCMYNGKI